MSFHKSLPKNVNWVNNSEEWDVINQEEMGTET